MIPEKNRPEWTDLVTGKKSYILKNYVLQMKVSQAIKDIRDGKVTIRKVIDELFSLCTKYEKAVADDMKTIFG